MSLVEILTVIALTFFPFVELRGSIPYGLLATSLPWYLVLVLAVAANWVIAPLLFLFLKFVMNHVDRWWPWLGKNYRRYERHAQKRIHKHVDKYGTWGIAVFIGIPLPFTGVFSGTVAAYALGMHFNKAMLATFLGVLLAATIVTAVVLTGNSAVLLVNG